MALIAPVFGSTDAPPNWTYLSVSGRTLGLIFAARTFFTASSSALTLDLSKVVWIE